jgi:hypothetical protein
MTSGPTIPHLVNVSRVMATKAALNVPIEELVMPQLHEMMTYARPHEVYPIAATVWGGTVDKIRPPDLYDGDAPRFATTVKVASSEVLEGGPALPDAQGAHAVRETTRVVRACEAFVSAIAVLDYDRATEIYDEQAADRVRMMLFLHMLLHLAAHAIRHKEMP